MIQASLRKLLLLALSTCSALYPVASIAAELHPNPNQALSKGETPLMVATGLGNVTMVKTLLAGGANVRAKDLQGVTALHIIPHRVTLFVVIPLARQLK